MAGMTQTTDVVERGFSLRRMVDATPEEVFRAWTDAAHLHWFSSGVGEPDAPEVDLRVGGAWRQMMILDEETDYVTGGIYREIQPPDRLVFTWGAVGGWPEIRPDGLDAAPLVTVTLRAVGDKTELMFDLELPVHLDDDAVAEELATGMAAGWTQTIDRLVESFV